MNENISDTRHWIDERESSQLRGERDLAVAEAAFYKAEAARLSAEAEAARYKMEAEVARYKAEAEVARYKAEARVARCREEATQAARVMKAEAVNGALESPALLSILSAEDYDGQLNRYHFVSRLILERHMLELVFRFLLFVPLLILFVFVVVTYDPLVLVGNMHSIIKSQFGLDKIEVTSREQLYTFMDAFIAATYDHAAVLIVPPDR